METDDQMTASWPVFQYTRDGWSELEDEVAEEMPLTVRLDGLEFATLVCSASDLTDLVYGFLASEGAIMSADDVLALDWDEDRGMVDLQLKRKMTLAQADFGKRVISSCCGKSRQFYLKTDVRTAKTVTTRIQVTAQGCLGLMEQLQASSDDFARTGGVHNAALCTGEDASADVSDEAVRQRMLAVRADIGRHNALDKLYGHAIRNKIRTSDKIIAFSGRLSSEVIIKTAKIGAGVIVSKSAPTALALRLAHDLGITAIGFARGGRLNVYTHPERVDVDGIAAE
ncbi:formate dehydrogenase accessory sulfurtransferase FdhD [Paenibacillus abyssi]|uniref:Sulfur carrier protein FdhD n=1 Tax=Paenibacillus abyssi TaxID=1340531 RepID=A0A917G3W5_9BACL|nr:formate dehydrogenase accessory sulfurtransferase FdhD [Paenibacillus abyssi]GGG21180.1 sulfurtransferase FdhD [Paenibacillus abyssi]